MSRKYNDPRDVPHETLARRLEELVRALKSRGEERDRELTMRIPAEVDRDFDLVMVEAARRLRGLDYDA